MGPRAVMSLRRVISSRLDGLVSARRLRAPGRSGATCIATG